MFASLPGVVQWCLLLYFISTGLESANKRFFYRNEALFAVARLISGATALIAVVLFGYITLFS